MGKERINKNILYMSELGILIAILLLMAFTPVGYLRIGTMTITFLTVPVVVGAIVCGPGAGTILGTIFGLTSFYQCFGMDPMGTALMQISLPRTFAFTVLPRLLMGLCVGLIFKAFKKRSAAAYTVTAFFGPFLNTLFFMTTLIACFWHTDVIQAWAASIPRSHERLPVRCPFRRRQLHRRSHRLHHRRCRCRQSRGPLCEQGLRLHPLHRRSRRRDRGRSCRRNRGSRGSRINLTSGETTIHGNPQEPLSQA